MFSIMALYQTGGGYMTSVKKEYELSMQANLRLQAILGL